MGSVSRELFHIVNYKKTMAHRYQNFENGPRKPQTHAKEKKKVFVLQYISFLCEPSKDFNFFIPKKVAANWFLHQQPVEYNFFYKRHGSAIWYRLYGYAKNVCMKIWGIYACFFKLIFQFQFFFSIGSLKCRCKLNINVLVFPTLKS